MKLIWSGLLALASVNALELPRVHKPLTKRSTEEGKLIEIILTSLAGDLCEDHRSIDF